MAGRTPRIDPKKKGTRQPTDFKERIASEAVSESTIAALAYLLWQERGRPIGSGQDDWFRAEEELKGRTGSVSTTAGVAGATVLSRGYTDPSRRIIANKIGGTAY
jgi:hypothetical protein